MKTSIYLSAVILLIASCTQQPQPADNNTAGVTDANIVTLTRQQLINGEIVTGFPERRNLARTIQVSGSIEAPPGNVISVSFPLGGYIRKLNLLPGTKVTRGEILVTLEDPHYIQLQQDYLAAKSRLSYLQTEYDRQKELNVDKTTSDKLYQQVKDEYERQKILLKALSEKLKLISINPDTLTAATLSGNVNIYAPISGYVTDIFVNTGKYVGPTDVLFELVDPSDVHLILNVYESDISSIAVGQGVACYLNNKPDKKYMAKVHLVSKSVHPDRTSEVHCDFDKGVASEFLPGMFVTAEVELANRTGIAVPDDAVVRWENKPYVFTVQSDTTFGMTAVETGFQSEGFTEIKAGLNDQELVVKNAYTLLMKLKSTED
jgi:cobalt-zinc-cadmium efflux system membrane fusion protein